MRDIEFAKLQACGNDFLIVSSRDLQPSDSAANVARRMCDRNHGAGADGVVFVTIADDSSADFRSRIFNADGSEAEISGNGTRCLAAYLYFSGKWSQPEVRIDTAAGVKRGRLISRDGVLFEFEFDMGAPRFSSREIPVDTADELDRVVGYEISIAGKPIRVTCLSMGNPHCSLFVEGPVNIDEVGPLVEKYAAFPNGTNVEFVKILSREEIQVGFWERGVGRTLSSGTGSSAAAVASALNNLTGRKVLVRTSGGNLRVNWRDDNSVWLRGPAEIVYRARWLKGLD